MLPLGVAPLPPCRRRLRTGRVAVEPELHAVMVKLLGPEQPGIRLALNSPLIFVQPRRLDGPVELVGLAPSAARRSSRSRRTGRREAMGEARSDRERSARRDHPVVVGRRFRASPAGIDLVGAAADDRFVKRILDERPGIGHSEEPLEVGLILGEKQRRQRAARCRDTTSARPGAGGGCGRRMARRPRARAFGVIPPRPGVAKPDLRQDMQRGRLRTAIDRP